MHTLRVPTSPYPLIDIHGYGRRRLASWLVNGSVSQKGPTMGLVEVYPMLPGQIDLILRITTALRTCSARAQGDDQAIRGLLQLLGELFRDQKLAEQPMGTLVTLDRIYEVQHTALDSDVQASMARVLSQCSDDADGLLVRTAKAVALLELIQDAQATGALEELRRRNLLGYSERHGYKIQSSAVEEWARERRDIGVTREAVSEIVRSFPRARQSSDGRRADISIADPRDDAAVRVDLLCLP